MPVTGTARFPGPRKQRARQTRRSAGRDVPSEGSSTANRCANRVTPSCAPSREGSVLLGVLSANDSRGYQASPSPAATSAFRPDPAVSLRPPSTSDLRLRLHPPASFPPPPEYCDSLPAHRISIESCDQTSTGERLPLGSVPHRGINQRRPPLSRESQPQSHVPSSPFLTTSRVCSASSLCGFVSPRCHVPGLPYRGLSLTAEPYRVSPADSCPRAVERISLQGLTPAPAFAPSPSGPCSPR